MGGVEDGKGGVAVRGAWCVGELKERVRSSCRVVVDGFGVVRLDGFGLRDGLFCGWSECERLLEGTQTSCRSLSC